MEADSGMIEKPNHTQFEIQSSTLERNSTCARDISKGTPYH